MTSRHPFSSAQGARRRELQGTFGGVQGTFGDLQETFGHLQGTFGDLQGTFGGVRYAPETNTYPRLAAWFSIDKPVAFHNVNPK